MTEEEIEDLKRKLQDCKEKLRRAEDDIQRIKSGCSPLYYTLPNTHYDVEQ